MHIILAPTSLGLRPLYSGHLPGSWRAPQVLLDCGLAEQLQAQHVVALPVPLYSPDAQPGTHIRNGHAIRAFCLELADAVANALAQNHHPLVIGGDCSVLLGALAGVRRTEPISLIHIDGHSDFRHPGNYNVNEILGAVAGMDLALVTGRGEKLLTDWPGVDGPLVPDRNVLQLGERESHDVDFAWPDIAQTAIKQIDVFEANRLGLEEILRQTNEMLSISPHRFWVHFDVDVLDKNIMPAVDSPGSPGIPPQWIEIICAQLAHHPQYCGMTFSVYDPDLDPDRRYAAFIVNMLKTLFFTE